MVASSTFDDLGPAVDLILQPLLVEALVAIDEGKALEDALPAGTDTELLSAALQRLVEIGAVRPLTTGPFGHHSLTGRGGRLLRLLEDLDTAMPIRETVGRDGPVCSLPGPIRPTLG